MVLAFCIWFSYAVLGFIPGGESLYERHEKRTQKTLSKLYEGQQLSIVKLSIEPLPEQTASALEIYTVSNEQDMLQAYMCLNEAPSKVDTFTYLVLYDSSMNVIHVAVLEYKENYGGEISSKRFLRQFQGSNGNKALEMSVDVDGISGATISVQSILLSINELNQNMLQLKENGVL